MLTVVSDTHATEDHRLEGRTLEAVRSADLVVHAGDFYTETVLDAFYEEADTLRAVYGNNDDSATRERLPEERVVEYAGIRFAVTHRRRGGATALTLFGRERDADAVIFGHSHRPTFDDSGAIPLLNPGSHAQPRGNQPAHAELERVEDAEWVDDAAVGESDSESPALAGRLVTPDGEIFERFRISKASS
ncbi:MAG: metallophosphoesterase [Halopenitus sp.]